MKTLPILTLLSLTLAACSQGTLPGVTSRTAPSSSLSTTETGPVYMGTQAAYDAQAFLQVIAPNIASKAYLNVYPVVSSPDSVRAYVRTTFASPVTTSINWGDGSATTTVSTPTVGHIETKDHAYATFGSYTVTLSSVNAGVVVDTRVFTVQAGKKPTGVVLNFDSPAAPSGQYVFYSPYTEQGFTLTANNPQYQYIVTFSPSYTDSFSGYNWGDSQGAYTNSGNNDLVLTASNNGLFSLKSFDARDIYQGKVADFDVTGYRQDGTVLVARSAEVVNGGSTVTLSPEWTNLTRVTFGNANLNTPILLDNVAVVPAPAPAPAPIVFVPIFVP